MEKQQHLPSEFSFSAEGLLLGILVLSVCCLLVLALRTSRRISSLSRAESKLPPDMEKAKLASHLSGLDGDQLSAVLKKRRDKKGSHLKIFTKFTVLTFLGSIGSFQAIAQVAGQTAKNQAITQPGVIITILLLLIPVLVAIAILVIKAGPTIFIHNREIKKRESERLARYLQTLSEAELDQLEKRKQALDYIPPMGSLSGLAVPEDPRGILQITHTKGIPIVEAKKKAQKRPEVDPALSLLIKYFLCSATFWLVFGTSVGEYLGIKFIAPEVDSLSWLSFGRLRPVHTNSVFWGWASMAMLGLGHYVVPRVSNSPLYSIKLGWYALYLINFSVICGTICLMEGINNGGGEYREYTWPVMLCFAVALVLTLFNFLKTVATRKTAEIYISNWYIISSVIFAITITIVAYVPYWQDGLGETIIQGYYMHQGVGMWFMLFTLGLVYYFLPQQLNRPIYSYSLGILAFWAQILFYTTIGTHHFVFSAIPWWLQTVAIVGSVGMVIPVVAGTANFIATFRGAWAKLQHSYTLPFFLVGIVFYFTGSLQGTAEAFRYTNLIWHFTDFTVAHSHITMYGSSAFFPGPLSMPRSQGSPEGRLHS